MLIILAYIIGGIIVGYMCGKTVYLNDPNPKFGEFRGGNKRSAVVVGFFYGIIWPISLIAFLTLYLVIAFVDWVQAGRPS